jgi:hypothetical protein
LAAAGLEHAAMPLPPSPLLLLLPLDQRPLLLLALLRLLLLLLGCRHSAAGCQPPHKGGHTCCRRDHLQRHHML